MRKSVKKSKMKKFFKKAKYNKKLIDTQIQIFSKFSIGGVMVTLLSIFLFPFLEQLLNSIVLAYIIASIVTILISYLVQRNYVFKSNQNFNAEILIFFKGAILINLFNLTLIYLGKEIIGISNLYYLNFLVAVIVATTSYIYHNYITFFKYSGFGEGREK